MEVTKENRINSVTPQMVSITKDWLLSVSKKFELSLVVFQKGCEYIDQYLGRYNMEKSNLQLLGIVCLSLSDILHSSLYTDTCVYIDVTDNSYTEDQFRNMLDDVLSKVNLNLNTINLFDNDIIISGKTVTYLSGLDVSSDTDKSREIKLLCLVFNIETEYTLEDIKYTCEGLSSNKWSRGYPRKLIEMIIKSKKGNWMNKYNSLTKNIPILYDQPEFIRKQFDKRDHELTGYIAGITQHDYLEGHENCVDCGSVSTVYEKDGFALKVVSEDCEQPFSECFIRELRCYQTIKSDYIGEYIGFHYSIIKMQLYPRSFYDLIISYSKPDIPVIDNIMLGVCKGLRDIHSYGIIHLDLKAENIMLTEDNQPKIIDFGSSLFYNTSSQLPPIALQTCTIRAPETENDIKCYDYKVDIWSLGCTYYGALFKSYFLHPKFHRECIDKSYVKKETNKIEHPVFRSCLEYKPEKRPTSEEVVRLLEAH